MIAVHMNPKVGLGVGVGVGLGGGTWWGEEEKLCFSCCHAVFGKQ